MSIDAHQAAALIASHVNKSLQNKSGGIGTTVQTDFCHVWTQAKPVLTLVEEFIGSFRVPGTIATVGGVLAGLIAVGEEISKQVCPPPHP